MAGWNIGHGWGYFNSEEFDWTDYPEKKEY